MTSEIITIGDEILIGQIVDTNSAWLSAELSKSGVKTIRISSVGDVPSEIKKSLKEAINRADIVLLTGGLGPTKDDLTKKILCEFFHSKLILSESVLKNIKNIIKAFGIKNLNNSNYQQAMVPDNCELLKNPSGTAPGMLFRKNNSIIISMPGVPFEMKSIFTNEIVPILKKLNKSEVIVQKVIMTQGAFEAQLSEKLEVWENNLKKSGISLAYLPQPGLIRLRLTVEGKDRAKLNKLINIQVKRLEKIIPDNIYGFDEELPEENIGKLLIKNKLTLATAESCSGGHLAHKITSVPGASEYFLGSVVAYSNKVKTNMVKVPEKIITKHGAVSKEVVESMAENISKIFSSDCSIATSGIAGPGGGTKEKPTGTTWIAVFYNGKIRSEKFNFGENRERNIIKTSYTAINMLRKLIITENI